ncbi:MAG: TROVE domain-containing protein [Lachnospiraceae bacterium]|nr:TROVE domain-containing protein [Lachnospiraceae bacterium]
MKFTKAVKEKRSDEKTKRVMNFMGGNSYEVNPIDTLKLVTASSIFGEPQYYRDGEFADKTIVREAAYTVDPLMTEYVVLSADSYGGITTSHLMERVIDEALDYDFGATLEWAATLRREYYMRLNPQIIMVRAALSKKRSEYIEKNKNGFADASSRVLMRADDVISQFTYYLYKTDTKRGIPAILKRSWARYIESLSRYELFKYKNRGLGLIDVIRICHANNADIDELMQTGTIAMPEEDKTWETLKASGKTWSEVLDILGRLPHMALLRNLRGIFSEIDDVEKTKEILEDLKGGVLKGKQFPFRYLAAKKAVEQAPGKVHHLVMITDALEECLDISCQNLPMLKGNNAFLSDNSGSAWGTCNSEYGRVTIAEIDNLSAVIGAANSETGTVIKFGDKMIKHEISKRNGILSQAQFISKTGSGDVGGSTENGVWLFFDEAINKKIVYDNIFIYSDMQAGHGGLYGTDKGKKQYREAGFAVGHRGDYIDVAKLIAYYRGKVNPEVNVFCIQTAGYNNVVVPENGYRTSLLYGWTGKELVYADMINKVWDEKRRSQT